MKDKELKQLCLNILETAEVACLTTIDKNRYPNTRAMFNLRNKHQFPNLTEWFQKHQDDFWIYFTTNTSSPKIDQIKANPAVSAFYCRPKEFLGLMFAGNIEIVTDSEIKKALWHKGWEIYYPKGISDPDYSILRLCPIFAKGWHWHGSFKFVLKK